MMHLSTRNRNNRGIRAVLGLALVLSLGGAMATAADKVTIKEVEGNFRVEINGELFTEYLHKGQAKPVLYPIIGPHGAKMTRNYPLGEATKGEAKDHPHHTSLWFTHGDVNGVDFWSVKGGSGKIEQHRLIKVADVEDYALLKTANSWKDKSGKVICSDMRTIVFKSTPFGRVIDYSVQVYASEGVDVTFGDTKEGSMAIRTHPALRLKGPVATGKAINDKGVKDKALWGKRAAWVDYWGTIDGKTVGVSIMEHPSNERHPTWWHARDYGLVAANPFGLSYFEKAKKGAGNMVIKGGHSKIFRYQFLFHEGDASTAKITEAFKQFAASKPY